jgi:ribonuclease-3 family protein
MNALALAYIGDAVYELAVREYVLSQGNYRQSVLHNRSVAYVSAKSQANIVKKLEPLLSDEELAVVKRGRNTKGHAAPKNTEVVQYRYSTGFEALIGYLYLTGNTGRLQEILGFAISYVEGETQDE